MSLALDEKTLESVASNGEMDYTKWPSIIEPLLQRLNQIVYTEFPMPRPYPTVNRPPLSSSPTQTQPTPVRDSNPLQTPSTPVRNLPPVPPFPNSSATTTSLVPDSLPPSQDQPSDSLNELPALLLQILNSLTYTLRSAFSERPPHTIQRLAELVLYPTKHYKTLPAWLRAVDRVVSVSSAADIFPLSDAPAMVNGVNGDGGGGILWNNNGYDSNSLGSDESLGGALLTPIPWLRNGVGAGEDSSEDSTQLDSANSASSDGLGESIMMPTSHGEGDSLVPERADGAVTQGELMRMEQEAGVVPVNQNHHDRSLERTGAGAEDGLYVDEGDLLPHARGPEVVGSVDMGRVGGQDVEIHIGSPPPTADGNDANANNAQIVLPRDNSLSSANPETTPTVESTADSEDFEIVLKDGASEGVDSDAMQLDETEEQERKKQQQQQQATKEQQDGDIVLVDADGKTEYESDSKSGATGENVEPDAADASAAT